MLNNIVVSFLCGRTNPGILHDERPHLRHLEFIHVKWHPAAVTLLHKSRWFLTAKVASDWPLPGDHQNNEYPRAMLPSLHTICISGKWTHATCNVSPERHTGAARLNAAYVRLPYGSQGVPTHVRGEKKRHRVKNYFITLRCSKEM